MSEQRKTSKAFLTIMSLIIVGIVFAMTIDSNPAFAFLACGMTLLSLHLLSISIMTRIWEKLYDLTPPKKRF